GAILALQFNHGLASGDVHGILRTTQALLNGGQLAVSPPPGHPTTEFISLERPDGFYRKFSASSLTIKSISFARLPARSPPSSFFIICYVISARHVCALS